MARSEKDKENRRRPCKKRKVEDADCINLRDLKSLNKYYVKNVLHGMLVACDKCNKWRLVEEYQEICDVPEFFECSMWKLGDEEKGNCFIPQIQDERKFTNEKYTPGSLVWAKMAGYPRWPAMVEDHPEELVYCKNLETDPKYHVVFLGGQVSRNWIKERDIEPFSKPTKDKMPARKDLKVAVEEAAEGKKMKKEERLMAFSFASRFGKKKVKHRNRDDGASSSKFKQDDGARTTKLQTDDGASSSKSEQSDAASFRQLEPSLPEYKAGDLVWVERKGYPRWPGMVENYPAQTRYYEDIGPELEYPIVFFGEKAARAWIKGSSIEPFSNETPTVELKKAIVNVEEAMKLTKEDRLTTFSFAARNEKKRLEMEKECSETEGATQENRQFSDLVSTNIPRIKSLPTLDKSLSTEDFENGLLSSVQQKLLLHVPGLMDLPTNPDTGSLNEEDSDKECLQRSSSDDTTEYVFEDTNQTSQNFAENGDLTDSSSSTSDSDDGGLFEGHKLYSFLLNEYFPPRITIP